MSAISQTELNTSWNDANLLIQELRAKGVAYLIGDEMPIHQMDANARAQISAIELIQHLAACSYPRIRDASISLFLLHPELAPDTLHTLQISEPEVRQQLATLVLATLYLQRLWSIQLTLALGHPSNFPETPFTFLWHTLPTPAYHEGKWGLQMLQARRR